MCVKELVLSAFVDGELEDKERRKVEEHLEECAQCRSSVERLRRVKTQLREGDMSASLSVADAQERVRAAVGRHASRRRAFVNRRIYLPLPAVMAAGALILVLAGALLGLSLSRAAEGLAVSSGQENRLETATAPSESAEMEELIRFLSSQGASVEVRIQLPNTNRFSVRGEPKLIKATEFEGY